MRPDSRDPFGPPDENIRVICLHCGKEYDSKDMFHDGEFWRCGTPDCDGAGFGFDVYPATDPMVSDLRSKTDVT